MRRPPHFVVNFSINFSVRSILNSVRVSLQSCRGGGRGDDGSELPPRALKCLLYYKKLFLDWCRYEPRYLYTTSNWS